jgi:predicted esterase
MRALVLLLALLTPAVAAAQAPAVTRADLARTYTRLDALLSAQALPLDAQRRVNEAFDRGTLSFFLGRGAETIAQLDSVTVSLDPSWPLPLLAWRLVPQPARVVAGDTTAVTIALVRLYGTWSLPSTSTLHLRAEDGRVGARFQVMHSEDRSDRAMATLAPDLLTRLTPGRYHLWLHAGGDSLRGDDLIVLAEPLETTAAALRARLDALPRRAELAVATEAVTSRLTLLTMRPDPNSTAQLLADPLTLVPAITAEVEALERGTDPFVGWTGDRWQTMTVGGTSIPLRIVAPARPTGATGGRALIIALHGAGMDENAFIDGYGSGIITRLAAELDAVVASPATPAFARSAVAFDTLVARMVREQGVDPSRVVVVGHSAGAAATIGLAAQRGTAIRAVAALAGAGAAPAGATLPPALIIGAAMDPVIPEARVRAQAEQLQAAGHRVEYRALADWGHTLMVGEVLPEVLRWLLAAERGR